MKGVLRLRSADAEQGDSAVERELPPRDGLHVVTMPLPREGNGDAAATRLRLELALAPGFLRLHRLALEGGADGGAKVLWEARGAGDIARRCALEGLSVRAAPIGETLLMEGDTAAIGIDAGEIDMRSASPRLVVELDWPRSTEFLIARDSFLREQGEMIVRLREQDAQLAALRRQVEELELIKRSRVWRTAEVMRRAVYVRAPGWVRGLRRRAGEAAADLRARIAGPQGSPAAEAAPDPYLHWLAGHVPNAEGLEQRRRRIPSFARKPRISIVMPVYNVDPRWLERAIESVRGQVYGNWELAIADDCSSSEATRSFLHAVNDPRIRVRFLRRNRGISGATNEALALASGDYVAFMDNDDELSPDALYEMVREINASDADMLYSDEDFISPEGRHCSPHFKPDFSPDLLLSHNYITHLLVLRRDLLARTGGLRSGFDGAQDYDLVLRASELAARIAHVPRVLYHWRMGEWSTSFDADAKPASVDSARRALDEALGRRGIDAEVMPANLPNYFRVKRRIRDEPLVSIIVPFRDKPDLLRTCLESVLERSTWPAFEIIGVSNNSEGVSTFELMKRLETESPRVRFVELNVPFNFSRLVNHGVAQSDAPCVMLLNNDIEIITWEWIEALLEHAQRPDVGAVGGKLYYPDNTVQHAGIMVGLGGYAGHAHLHFPASSPGYFNRLNVVQNVSAVTGAFLMTRRERFDEVGGFDEQTFPVAYNDVDFCLRLRSRGYLNVFTPYAQAWHHESLSRGYEDTPERRARFETEMRAFRARYGELCDAGDPYYNVNLDQGRDDFALPGMDAPAQPEASAASGGERTDAA